MSCLPDKIQCMWNSIFRREMHQFLYKKMATPQNPQIPRPAPSLPSSLRRLQNLCLQVPSDTWSSYRCTVFRPKWNGNIGIRHGVFKGIENSRRPPALKGRAWQARVKLKEVHNHPLPYAHEWNKILSLMIRRTTSSRMTFAPLEDSLKIICMKNSLAKSFAGVDAGGGKQPCSAVGDFECHQNSPDCIGVWRGVSKGVEDGYRPPALWASHIKLFQG
jgi:hypothetical protein